MTAEGGRARIEDIQVIINAPPGVKVTALDYFTSRALADITVSVLAGVAAATNVFACYLPMQIQIV